MDENQQPASDNFSRQPAQEPENGYAAEPMARQEPQAYYAPVEEAASQRPADPAPNRKGKMILVAVAAVAIIGGTAAYAFLANKGLLSTSSYSEENFFTNLLAKSAQINSSTYSASISFDIGPREEGAVPFTVRNANDPELRQRYQNDYDRVRDVSGLLSLLSATGGYYYGQTQSPSSSYPASLEKALESASQSRYYSKPSITDPATRRKYQYRATENGKNFTLTVTFETQEAIAAIKRYGYTATGTPISGKTVTFTKASQTYLYLSSEPPRPLLAELADDVRSLPPDVNASAKVTASSESKKEGLPDWAFNFDAQGSFGDLTYKVNVDALKKGKDYYFKVNNIPSLFLGSVANLKGTWLKVSAKEAAATGTSPSYYGGDELSYIARQIPEMEAEYKKSRERSVKFMRLAASLADDAKLIVFRSKPRQETVDGRKLTRYDVGFRKEAILPFYKKLSEEVSKDKDLSPLYKDFADPGLIEYLEGSEFAETFDYVDKNMKLVFWTDSQGFPAIFEATYRLVPPDTAVQLKDKQANVKLRTVLSNVNGDVKIEAPEKSTPIEKAVEQFKNNMYGSGSAGAAAVKSNLANLRAYAEIAYDNNGNSYGKKPFKLGPCSNAASTLFADSQVYAALEDATNGSPSNATCVSTVTSGKVESYAVSVPMPDSASYSWCIDSAGNARQISGKLRGSLCI